MNGARENPEMPLVKGVLFDLDGVIVFTDRYHFLAWKKLADLNGWHFDESINRQCRGRSRMASLQAILDANGIECSDEETARLAAAKNAYYVESLRTMSETDLYPGVLDFFERLKAWGLKLAVCSSSRNAFMVLERLGLEVYFDAVVDGSDIRSPKPDPEIFLLGAERLGLLPTECVVFEDAESGIEAARSAGMFCIGVGSGEDLAGASFCIHRYDAPELDGLWAQS